MKHCPKCNTAVEEAYVFCHKCGADLRIPRCSHCGKELPGDAQFCPWCGKPLPAVGNPAPQAVNTGKLTFTLEDQVLLKELLKTHFKDGELLAKPDRIFWEDRFTGWGSVDDYSWEDTEFVLIEPLNTQDRAKYAKNGALYFPDREKLSGLFRAMMENAQGCLFFEHRGPHKDSSLNVHWKDTLIVANPYGIGMDVMVVHESYDDKD